MDFRTKLKNLSTETNLALYRWSIGKSRIVDGYAALSDIRLSVISCDHGTVRFSSSAPVVMPVHGVAMVRFMDRDLVTVTSGSRRGVNIRMGDLHEDEVSVPTTRCVDLELADEGDYPKWIKSRVMSMGCADLCPVSGIVVPDMYRLTRNASSIRPVVSRQLMRWLCGESAMSAQGFREQFVRALENEKLGFKRDYGYLIPFEFVASGGFCVVPIRGMSTRAGSLVHVMPLDLFRDEVSSRQWKIMEVE